MKKIKRMLLLLMALLVVIGFFGAGPFLYINEKPVHSDVIIVLGGGAGEREGLASALYKEGYAPYVMVSNGGARDHPTPEVAELEMGWLKADGVPGSAIIPELKAQSTYGNAVYTEKMMKKHGFKSAIVVSSSYHMRRSHYIFQKLYKGSGIALHYKGAKTPHYNPTWWWTTEAGWKNTISEYIKLVGYIVLYGIF
ncbi:YdcF family protein [Pullulanibacillus camelliae]|nr:YdcF family protein [Pullulanibacillus camelliae]